MIFIRKSLQTFNANEKHWQLLRIIEEKFFIINGIEIKLLSKIVKVEKQESIKRLHHTKFCVTTTYKAKFSSKLSVKAKKLFKSSKAINLLQRKPDWRDILRRPY